MIIWPNKNPLEEQIAILRKDYDRKSAEANFWKAKYYQAAKSEAQVNRACMKKARTIKWLREQITLLKIRIEGR